ncbi:MAG: GNAT family N-acetyltransferase [Actinomycetota bacterium]
MGKNNLTIEPLEDFDPGLIEQIKGLETEAFGNEAAANQWLIPVIIRYGKVILAWKPGGELVGVCLAVKDWGDRKTAFIHSFHLKKSCRSKGLGTRFLSGTIEIIKKENIDRVKLTVSPENKQAINLYHKHGFKSKGLYKNEYGEKIDRFLMELKL